MSRCEVQIDDHHNLCPSGTVAIWTYGDGGPELSMCRIHDRMMQRHLRECATMQLDEDEERGDCRNYLGRREV